MEAAKPLFVNRFKGIQQGYRQGYYGLVENRAFGYMGTT